jgi:hypothetical protein
MEEITWSCGIKPERSSASERTHEPRQERPEERTTGDDHQASADHGKQAIMTALDFGDPLNGFRVCSSRRDDANAKIGERELIGRVSHNPFLVEETYLNDITVEDRLLRPRNTKD